MTDDDRLQQLLRSARAPAADRQLSRDLWPLVENRMQVRARWSWLDVSLAAAVAIVLLMFPGGLFLLAYHL
jgi:nuclear transport factor 2 (NTF2) superfamily protein